MIKPGYYRGRAVKVDDEWAQFGVTSKGTQQVLIYFEILDEVDWEGERLPWFGFFGDNSWERTIESLQYCGFEGDDLDTLNDQELDQEVSVKVEHETSETNGRTYARIAFVNKPGGGGIKLANPMDAGDKRNFAAMMKDRIRGKSAASGKAQSSAAEPWDEPSPPPLGTGDDVPF